MMANETFPKLPVKSWWLLRDAFNRKLPAKVTRNYLATVLNVAEPTAGNVLPELRQLGLLDENGAPSDLANRWRFDEDYPAVCQEIRKKVYPQEVVDAVPEPSGDAAAVTRWFQRHASVGEGAAKNMARLYTVITEADPLKRPEDAKAGKERTQTRPARTTKKRRRPSVEQPASPSVSPPATPEPPGSVGGNKKLSLHIDLQVHISPEASLAQIDQIFKSIRKHLYAE